MNEAHRPSGNGDNSGIRSVIRTFAIAGLTLISVLAWSAAGGSEHAGRPRITVEVDVYSGRPNPSWQLNAVQARLVLRMLSGVSRPGRSGRSCELPSLGYRGLNLTIVEGERTSTWRVFNRCVDHDGRAFSDAGARVQAFILRTMPPNLKSDLAGVLPGD
jgi:hypothetical protein